MLAIHVTKVHFKVYNFLLRVKLVLYPSISELFLKNLTVQLKIQIQRQIPFLLLATHPASVHTKHKETNIFYPRLVSVKDISLKTSI